MAPENALNLPSVTVTPKSPLNISSAVPGFDVLTIAGGVVTVTANVTFTINRLVKES